jgi:tetratricopeptide (TPR) repeat protein
LPWGAAPPAAPELKPEEVTALDFYEKALAARADHSHAHLGIAELLAPHAIRKQEVELAKKKSRPPRRGKAVEPTPEPATGPDWTPERVIREYRAAWQADPKSKAAVEGLIRFAGRVGRLDDAEAGLQELTQRDPERPEPFIHLADFLINDKKDPLGAVEQYKQALVWRADDDATRAKIADIYIAMGIEHWNAGQWSLADSRFKEAQKFVTDRNSPQGLKVRDYTGRLADIRHR